MRLSDASRESSAPMRPPTSFSCSKLNETTFLIIEDDSYGERPHIYVKIYAQVIFISDTGCNSPRQRKSGESITSLRQYLEVFPTAANDDRPLNPGGALPYLILCTHCHYDHILGIPPFLCAADPASSHSHSHSRPSPRPAIIASSHSKPFIQDDLATHSLCRFLHVPTPRYIVDHWAAHLSYLSYTPPPPLPPPPPLLLADRDPIVPTPTPKPIPLRIQLLHIPGHTPDSLAWYDIDAHHLYVGDMLYARRRPGPAAGFSFRVSGRRGALLPLDDDDDDDDDDSGSDDDNDNDSAIIFPREGDLVDYMSSLSLVLSFVQHWNLLLRQRLASEPVDPLLAPAPLTPPLRVKLGAGHVTCDADAETMILEVQELFGRILDGTVPVWRSEFKRGEVYDYWCEGEEAPYSVLAPRRLVVEARRHFGEERV